MSFWLLQAMSGSALVFLREIDDFVLAPDGPQGDQVELADAVRNVTWLQGIGADNILRIVASGGHRHFFDVIYVAEDGDTLVSRVDGTTGKVLRTTPRSGSIAEMTISRTLLLLHKELLSGSVGHWIIGFSGVFLLVTTISGMILAWPCKLPMRTVFRIGALGWRRSALFRWHRALGAGLAILLLVVASTGVMEIWINSVRQVLNAPNISAPAVVDLTEPPVLTNSAIGKAQRLARSTFPDGNLSFFQMPNESRPYFQVRLATPGEARKKFGTTMLFIDRSGTKVLKIHDATASPLRYRTVAGLYALHTGEILGPAGRLLSLLTGLGLVALCMLGIGLWWKRRRPGDMTAQAIRA